MTAAVLAIDGGNSKTDVCLISADGQLLGHARGAGSNHQLVGLDAAFSVLAGLVSEAAAEAGIDTGTCPAQHAAVYLAGADFPREVEMLLGRVLLAGWAAEVSLDNDTFALLRAGTSAANRIAVVCGAGINCVGVSAAGDILRFPSVGVISGDWGGGAALGTEALFLAVRAEDGRGQPTALREAIMQHFDTPSVVDVTAALHFGEMPRGRLHELVPVLLRVAELGDEPARAVVDRQAEEVFLFVRAAVDRLALRDQPTDVVLGGGVLATRHPQLMEGVSRRVAAYAPRANLLVVDDPPVVGAALLGLDALGASPEAEIAARAAMLARTRTPT
ncbi:MAG TPA: BadF/BadG/BcrA/BcrD ATPase family protein [Propionibacteriaceae bacterium]|nr:BadF/BadG/BcrA/BcrD ATPase family protein [Propionibacteriaceae bacterium]